MPLVLVTNCRYRHKMRNKNFAFLQGQEERGKSNEKHLFNDKLSKAGHRASDFAGKNPSCGDIMFSRRGGGRKIREIDTYILT